MAGARYVFIDIETAPLARAWENLSSSLQQHWRRKHQSLRYENEPADSFVQRAAIFAEFGQVICVGIGEWVHDPKQPEKSTWQEKIFSQRHGDEKYVLKCLLDYLENTRIHILVGHNIVEFDVPYLGRRFLALDLSLPKLWRDFQGKAKWNYFSDRSETVVEDTFLLWRFGDSKSFTSLELLADTLGIFYQKSLTPDEIVIHFHAGNWEAIENYCMEDVRTTAKVYARLKGLVSPFP
ncbi:MAG: 3'-5' exonuclease [Bacteroidia bacterium]